MLYVIVSFFVHADEHFFLSGLGLQAPGLGRGAAGRQRAMG